MSLTTFHSLDVSTVIFLVLLPSLVHSSPRPSRVLSVTVEAQLTEYFPSGSNHG